MSGQLPCMAEAQAVALTCGARPPLVADTTKPLAVQIKIIKLPFTRFNHSRFGPTTTLKIVPSTHVKPVA